MSIPLPVKELLISAHRKKTRTSSALPYDTAFLRFTSLSALLRYPERTLCVPDHRSVDF